MRACLRCDRQFESESIQVRVCPKCKRTATYRKGAEFEKSIGRDLSKAKNRKKDSLERQAEKERPA